MHLILMALSPEQALGRRIHGYAFSRIVDALRSQKRNDFACTRNGESALSTPVSRQFAKVLLRVSNDPGQRAERAAWPLRDIEGLAV
jgi:hypothetical protein